jgi:hypothetical protein
MLALETGAVDQAEAAFQAALAAWNEDDATAALARHYLQVMRN